MQQRIIQPLNRKKSFQTFDSLNPLPHILIRFQTNISHLRQRDVHEHADIRDRWPTKHQPVVGLQLFIEDLERLIPAESAFFEKDVEFLLRPLLVVSEAVVGTVVGEDGAVREDAVLDPGICEGEL